MSIPQFQEIIEPNDQTEARREHLEKLRELVGNVYPNKFERSRVSGDEDTITRLIGHEPVVAAVKEIADLNLGEREKPPAEIKDALNARLRELGNVRIAGRLAVPPRVMGKAAFVHLSDGISRLQIYVKRDEVVGVFNGIEPPRRGDAEEDFSVPSVSSVNSVVENAGTTENTERTEQIENPRSVSGWEVFQLLDHGDFIGVEGYLFITNTGELSVHVEKLQFLAKAMLPMPDKMHGIADPEIRQRQRYADLIASSLQIEHEGLTTREVFETRAVIISSMRRYLEDHGYIEVETPMLTPKATGAAAKPFETHHNALDITLYARIAPELYLKRLVVGGFEKVYELNRNFRNEGISYKHNPEFTMLEFYCAYMDVEGMMDFCEEMMKDAVQKATGGLRVTYGENEIDFSTFNRIEMKDAILAHFPAQFNKVVSSEQFDDRWIKDTKKLSALSKFADYLGPKIMTATVEGKSITTFGAIADDFGNLSNFLQFVKEEYKLSANDLEGKWLSGDWFWEHIIKPKAEADEINGLEEESNALALINIFESKVERHLIQPTFIIDYPKVISPLSKASPLNPNIAERFELFINGMEVANGFSELNDPREQYERFVEQMSERGRGDEEAMVLDEDYVRALSYGMPPAAGIGIGIDRLVMLLTNKHSIRDVILFPHMRPERREGEKGSEGEGE